jgi:phosphoenolpyruvate carboxykinase (GTP)
MEWCDGSVGEYDRLCQELVDAGTFERLFSARRPNSFLAGSDPSDIAHCEQRAFVCPASPDQAGLNNNWRDAAQMRERLTGLFRCAMQSRAQT